MEVVMLKYTEISSNLYQAKLRYKILTYCWRISIIALSVNYYNIDHVFAQDANQNEISLVWEDDFREFQTVWSGDILNFSTDLSQTPIRLNQISDSGNGTNSIFKPSVIFFGKWEFSI